jgi:hypothetical protein
MFETSGNVGFGVTTSDIFGRGYSGRIIGISSTGQTALELNSATGSGCYFDMGVNGTRYGYMYADPNGAEIGSIGATYLGLVTNGNTRMTIAAGGDITATGTITATNFILSSDERLKTNVSKISIKPLDISYKQFELISESNQLRYGVIAQEIHQNYPELVRIDDNGIMSVAYIDLMIREISYLKNKVKELENRPNLYKIMKNIIMKIFIFLKKSK